MSVWQFYAAVEGYVAAHCPDDGKMSDREADELFEWLKSKN